MNTNKKGSSKIFIILVAVVIVCAVVFFLYQNKKSGEVIENKAEGIMVANNEMGSDRMAAMEKGQMMEDGVMTNDEMKIENTGSYELYSQENLLKAEYSHVVLFFNASWCPTCRSAHKEFSSTSVPSGLTLLSVDYDTYTDLKKEYGVTYQHTFVEVDKDGNMIKKWSGGGLSKIQEMLNI